MISTSACRVSDRSRSRPASSRRLRVTHFLLRATLFHISPIPSRCAPHCRSGSPPSGCSTLITSAPCSPIQVAISGPAARVAASITRSAGFVVGLGKAAFYAQIDFDQAKAYAYAKEVMSMNALAEDANEGIAAFVGKRRPVWRT